MKSAIETVKWLLLSRPVDWLVGIALRARVASLRVVPAGGLGAGDRNLDSTSQTSALAEEEVEVVARAIDPADWRGFDAYVQQLGLDAAAQAAARKHRHGPIRVSLHRARGAIAALDEFRREKSGSSLQDT